MTWHPVPTIGSPGCSHLNCMRAAVAYRLYSSLLLGLDRARGLGPLRREYACAEHIPEGVEVVA